MIIIPYPNNVCKICNIKYYSCKSCNKNFRWKDVTCSIECFQIYMKSFLKDGVIMNKAKKLDVVHPLRGMTYENNQMHDFTDYEILSEKENWLLSTFENRKYEINDLQYLYVPRITFLDIIKDIRENAYAEGFNEGQKSKKTYKK